MDKKCSIQLKEREVVKQMICEIARHQKNFCRIKEGMENGCIYNTRE